MRGTTKSVLTADELEKIEEILLKVPGIDPFVKAQALDYYDGLLSFQAETA